MRGAVLKLGQMLSIQDEAWAPFRPPPPSSFYYAPVPVRLILIRWFARPVAGSGLTE